MYSEPEPGTAERMLSMHSQAAAEFGCVADGQAQVWGWLGSKFSRPVTAPWGPGWLRLVSARAAKIGGNGWRGPRDAETTVPATVPRPRLRRWVAWEDAGRGYLGELYERLPDTAAAIPDPVLRTLPDLTVRWWSQLSDALEVIAHVPTDRVAVRQEYLDQAMPEFLGVALDTRAPAWTTSHGDLHWANLTAPRLMLLDWERWGTAPAGYDAAILHSYSLLVPPVASAVRRHLGHILDTPAGTFAELVAITELLQGTSRGENLTLEPHLRDRLAFLLDRCGPCTPTPW